MQERPVFLQAFVFFVLCTSLFAKVSCTALLKFYTLFVVVLLVTTQLRPARFASYNASSARRNKLSGVSSAKPVHSAAPQLIVIDPTLGIEIVRACRRSLSSSTFAPVSGVSGIMSTNSSPPNRTMIMSVVRVLSRMSLASFLRAWSPAE